MKEVSQDDFILFINNNIPSSGLKTVKDNYKKEFVGDDDVVLAYKTAGGKYFIMNNSHDSIEIKN